MFDLSLLEEVNQKPSTCVLKILNLLIISSCNIYGPAYFSMSLYLHLLVNI